MCGICGQITFGNCRPRVETLAVANSSMTHRGPNDAGMYVDGCVALGHRRLSVIDLSRAGHQPMRNEKGTIWVVYNGEIYNFRQLRKDLLDRGYTFRSQTDTEAIIHLYDEMGEDCVKKLNGMFAIAIWDSREEKLFLARDRLGIKPLYYWHDSSSLVFASEVRALISSGMIPHRLSAHGLQSYLMYGAVQSPFTLIDGVRSLMPGHSMVIQNGKVRIQRYWDLDSPGDYTSGSAIEIGDLLEDAVKIRMVSDVPMGAFLSGGIDSSSIVSLMAQVSTSPVKTVSLVFQEKEFDERDHSRKVAEHFGTDHQEFTITEVGLLSDLPGALRAMDQPTVDGINSYFVSRAAKSAGLTVVLSGLGGDELFGGYESFHIVPYMRLYKQASKMLPGFIKNGLGALYRALGPNQDRHGKIADVLSAKQDILGHPYFFMRTFFSDDKLNKLLGAQTKFWTNDDYRMPHFAMLEKAASMDAVNQVSYLELMTYMRNMLLRDTDFMSMAHSIEVRAPLIDYRLVELMLTIPGKAKLNGVGSKHFLWQNLKRPLPSSAINRPKQGFTLPFARWLRQELQSEVREVLLTPSQKISCAVDQGQIEKIWKAFESGKTSWHRAWILYVLKKWVEINIEG